MFTKKSSHLLIKQKYNHESKVTLCFRPQRAWISIRKDLLMQEEDTWTAPAGQLHQRTACFDLSLSQSTGRNKGLPSETLENIKTMHHLNNNTNGAGRTQRSEVTGTNATVIQQCRNSTCVFLYCHVTEQCGGKLLLMLLGAQP